MQTEEIAYLKSKIREVPNFPKEGINFYDITTLLSDPKAFKLSIQSMVDYIKQNKIEADVIASTEARGFIFGAALAYELGLSFIPVRKPGKLPYKTESFEYEKEYGKDKIEIHKDAVSSGQKVLLVDDLLATGGTIKATAELVKKIGGELAGFLFLIELDFLEGRKILEGFDVPTHSILSYSK